MNHQDPQDIVARLNRNSETFLTAMCFEVLSVDLEKSECTTAFELDARYCHSGDIVQGGFVAAMLDAASTHAAFAINSSITVVATLELKVSYFEASRMGKFTAVGRVDKMTKSIAFMSGELFSPSGLLTASISTTAKIRQASAH